MNSFESPTQEQLSEAVLADQVSYELIFRGVREGFDKALLQQKFAQLFKLNAAQVEKIFSAKKIRLKTQLTKAQAKAYREKLFGLGFVVETPAMSLGVKPSSNLQSSKQTLADTEIVTPSRPSAAIKKSFLPDYGVCEQDGSGAMHQPIEAPFGEGVQRYPVQSSMTGASFFSVGTSNLLLCILSLGLWFPWARVRHWRYCFSQTQIAGQNFEFRGHPHYWLAFQLLLGVALVALAVAFFFSPLVFLIGIGLFAWVLPAYWGVKDFYFTDHMTYANEQFHSSMTIKKAYRIYGLNGLLILCTAGLAAPWAFKRIHEQTIATKTFGCFPLNINATTADYAELLKPLLAAWVLIGVSAQSVMPLPVWLSLLLGAVSIWGLLSYWKLRLDNLLWNSIGCGLGRWRRELDWQSSLKWQLSYVILMLASFGLLSPWLSAYRWRWLSQHTAFLAAPRFKKWLANQVDN